MLHIHNGDSSAGTAKAAQIPGEHVAWREALVCGPSPEMTSEEDFFDLRARHLSEAYNIPLEKCLGELRAMHEVLATFSEHDEVVLWFEHDLFCQVQLVYLLNWFAGRELGQTRLKLVCVNEFPGVQPFHGLGQLNEEQLRSLFPGRSEIATAQFELGVRSGQAYTSPDARSKDFLRRATAWAASKTRRSVWCRSTASFVRCFRRSLDARAPTVSATRSCI